MKNKVIKLGLGLGAALATTLIAIPSADAQLVYETRQAAPQVVLAQPAVAPVVLQQAPAITQPVQQMVAVTDGADATRLTRTELLRRERMRSELKNEDALKSRLEELRIRDERRRLSEINNIIPQQNLQGSPVQGYGQATAGYMQQPQVVAAPANSGTTTQDVIVTTHSSMSDNGDSVIEQSTEYNQSSKITMSPQIGGAGFAGTEDMGLEISSRFSLGASLNMEIARNLTIEGGYSYNEYGIALGNSPTMSQTYGYMNGGNNYGYNNNNYYNQENMETLALKQHVFDMGLKMHLMNRASTFRPYVGLGAAYAKGAVNYDDRILKYMQGFGNNQATDNYSSTSWHATLSTGFDIKFSQKVALGLNFKYFKELKSSQNNSLNAYGFYGYNPSSYGGFAGSSNQKVMVGDELARANFYKMSVGINFSL